MVTATLDNPAELATLRERLRQAAQNDNPGSRTSRARRRRRQLDGIPMLGTRLVREWNGLRHEVTATEGGFEYAGRKYKSLSAVAKAITGAHWSGPQFFGLRTPRKDGGQ